MPTFMRSSDAFTWAMESDPRLRSTVVTIILCDRAPDWDRLKSRFDTMARELPVLRQRVVSSPAPVPPRWEDAPDFDLDYHLRTMKVAAPGTFDEVLEIGRVAAMEAFDRARPLWHATLVHGVDHSHTAIVLKFHHSLTDGVGGVKIAMTLFDPAEDPVAPTPVGQNGAGPLLAAVPCRYRDGARLVGNAVAEAVQTVPDLLRSIRRPVSAALSVAQVAASVYRTVRPLNRTGSTLMTRRSLTRRLGVLEVPLPQLRAAAHRGGGRVNDAFVAGVAGGLRRYHAMHSAPVTNLHLTMPISLRRDGDTPGGNRITLMRFDVPVDTADPVERIRRIHSTTERIRHERSLAYTQWIAGALNVMPRWYVGSILRRVDFVCSDVPGIAVPVYLAGARVISQYAFGPTIGAAVNVTLLTYGEVCELGIDVDTGAIPDYDAFMACLNAGMDEVLACAAPDV